MGVNCPSENETYTNYATPLCHAARVGNIKLIDFFVNVLGRDSLVVRDTGGWIPFSNAVECFNSNKGFLAARKLIHLGTPINLINGITRKTLLEEALHKRAIKIAAMLLRKGGIARETELLDYQCVVRSYLEWSRRVALTPTPSEMTFRIGLQGQLPDDVLKHVLSYSAEFSHINEF